MTERWPVLHRCGHRVEWDLGERRPGDRNGFARWLAERDCTRCWWASRRDPYQQTRAARIQFLRALEVHYWERSTGMPALVGRPKAVAWARKIRHQLLNAAVHRPTASQYRPNPALEVRARRIRTARWWIDHRRIDPAQLVSALDGDWRKRATRQPTDRRHR